MSDTEMRLECVRLALGCARSEDVLSKAKEIYGFLTAQTPPDAPPSYDSKYLHG